MKIFTGGGEVKDSRCGEFEGRVVHLHFDHVSKPREERREDVDGARSERVGERRCMSENARHGG